jgi:hypothetical protein
MDNQLLILNHGDLGQLDRGAVGVAIDKALQEIGRDCLDRPSDDRARKLVLTLSFKPCPETFDQTISCERIALDVEIKAAVPARKSRTIDMGVRQGGGMIFNPESPANHKQPVMFDDGEEA